MTKFYSVIDWSRPWLASILPAAEAILAQEEWRAALNQAACAAGLSNHRDLPLQFIPQEELPEGVAYESHISAAGKVPTRENLHDFFNALVWLSFPQIKRQLNALQAAQIETLGIGKSRGPARDAATIFDENAALLVLENSERGHRLLSCLRAHQWQQAFVEHRNDFAVAAQVWSFGHALMEKLVQPYKGITAHAWVVWVTPEFFSQNLTRQAQQLDAQVSEQLQSHALTTADYTPLPVLGVPDWWSGQDESFYADQTVFRPKRRT
ncbi:DUF3025 domain-containing protein [Undibacterium fentianense]|uniref:DUF3025 domain-containing protein n=1 Tax=Undibacterium fentianense TaxID=2828728 RepID=A0A941E5A9_9BURK|nr:DUF3025 domain-containing protein [Undibacterium fentianense]MBR7800894.1 DUF3025 domain-containing protein [Undibacterium fentianense]